MSGEKKGCRELVFISECLLGIIKGSFTCKALEGQVRRIESYLDVEPLEGRYELHQEEIAEMSWGRAWI